MLLLTIGIPTYNRANYLEKLMGKIVPACEGKNVEILVADNCSTDNTSEDLKKYRAFRCVRVIRSPENIGFDGNIMQLLAKASGHFLWLMGDDDLIEIDKIDDLLHLLAENQETPLLQVGFRPEASRQPARKTGLTSFTLHPQQYVDQILRWATLISTNIINLEEIRKIEFNQECLGKGWIHLHLLLLLIDSLAHKNAPLIMVKDKVVIQGLADVGDYPISKWVRTFVYNFSFTLAKTRVKNVRLKKFLKGFYDINIRPRFLKVSDLIKLKNPLDDYKMIEQTFKLNLTGKISFWLQYIFLKKFWLTYFRK